MNKKFLSSCLAIGMIATAQLMMSCSKDSNEEEPYKPIDGAVINQEEAKKGYMTMVTETTEGKIKLYIVAEDADKEDVWIDLNNDGIQQTDEGNIVFDDPEDYNIGNNNIITIYGKVAELYCENNQITQLDISQNKNLAYLDCSYNGLNKLVSNNPNLIHLICNDNILDKLDVSKNTSLSVLKCYNNKLTQLDVSQNTSLTELNCASNNKLTQLDVSKNTSLTELNCAGNKLTQLDVSKNTSLTKLICGGNQLTQLDVSKNTSLIELSCSRNQLTEFDVSKNTSLVKLYCNNNQLTQLDISKNTSLEELRCHANQIQGDKMQALLNSLPNKNGAKLYVYSERPQDNEKNSKPTPAQINKVKTDKGWKVYFYDVNGQAKEQQS